MARSAKLTSIDAVREMAAAFAKFGDEAAAAIDDLDINVRRAIEWIEHDRKQYWEMELRRAWEQLAEARSELEKALLYRKVADYTPSCREERVRVEKAKRRVEVAEEVNRALPGWAHRIDHAVRELDGVEGLLADWLREQLPRAMGVLKQMSISLEAYAASRPAARTSTAGAAAPESESDAPVKATDEEGNNEEPNDENLGSPLAGGEAPSGDERPERG